MQAYKQPRGAPTTGLSQPQQIQCCPDDCAWTGRNRGLLVGTEWAQAGPAQQFPARRGRLWLATIPGTRLSGLDERFLKHHRMSFQAPNGAAAWQVGNPSLLVHKRSRALKFLHPAETHRSWALGSCLAVALAPAPMASPPTRDTPRGVGTPHICLVRVFLGCPHPHLRRVPSGVAAPAACPLHTQAHLGCGVGLEGKLISLWAGLLLRTETGPCG